MSAKAFEDIHAAVNAAEEADKKLRQTLSTLVKAVIVKYGVDSSIKLSVEELAAAEELTLQIFKDKTGASIYKAVRKDATPHED